MTDVMRAIVVDAPAPPTSALGAIRTPNLLIRSGLYVVAACGNVSLSVAP